MIPYFPLGLQPMGQESDDVPPPPRRVKPPAAVWFDPRRRDFPRDPATGLFVEVHPIDHKVELAIFVALGKIPVSPSTGSTIAQLAIGDDATMTSDALQRIRAALQDMITAGDVNLISVVATSGPTPGRAKVTVTYQNLRTPNAKPITLPVE